LTEIDRSLVVESPTPPITTHTTSHDRIPRTRQVLDRSIGPLVSISVYALGRFSHTTHPRILITETRDGRAKRKALVGRDDADAMTLARAVPTDDDRRRRRRTTTEDGDDGARCERRGRRWETMGREAR